MEPENTAAAGRRRVTDSMRHRAGVVGASALVALAVVGVSACSGGTELADPQVTDDGSAQTAVDPATGEEYEIPEDFELAFGDESQDEGTADPVDEVEGPPPVDESEATPPHPLENVVIDETASNEGEASLDESGSLACAQAEFALDALIAGDGEALADHVATAAELATSSSIAGLAPLAADLTAGDDLALTEDAVVAFLTACTEAGYEL